MPWTEPGRMHLLTQAQQVGVGELSSRGQGLARLLPSGDLEVRVSTSKGRCEYLITPGGKTTLTRSLPRSRLVRLIEALGLLGGVIALSGFVLVPVYGVLYVAGVVGDPGRWPGLILLAGWIVALGFVGLEDWIASRDSFVRTERGRDEYRVDESLPVGNWTALAKSIRVREGGEDGGGDGDGDGD